MHAWTIGGLRLCTDSGQAQDKLMLPWDAGNMLRLSDGEFPLPELYYKGRFSNG